MIRSIASSTVFMAMSKSAWPEGRTGDPKRQDWYLVVEEAVRLYKDFGGPWDILIGVTGFTNAGSSNPEILYYKKAFEDFGLVEGKNFFLIPDGIDTTTQLRAAYEFAALRNADLTIVSTLLHIDRVRWITWWDKINNLHHLKIVHFTPKELGISRKEEVKNDIILKYLFPVIDILGMRQVFLKYVEKRRASGKL